MPVTIKTPDEAFKRLHEALRYTGENGEQVMARKAVEFLREYVADLTNAALEPVVETADEPAEMVETSGYAEPTADQPASEWVA